MRNKTSRLPRRFDSVMKTLRALMDSKSERVRLAAVLRASDILLRHQEGEERAAVAIERAAARKIEAGNSQATADAPQAQGETTEQFLERVRAMKEKGTQVEY